MTRAGETLAALTRRLAPVSGSPALDAALLLAHVTGASRAALAAEPDRPLSPQQAAELEALAGRRLRGEPVAYLTGHKEFWSLDLAVTPEVLVPRPETELVVELALAALAGVARPAALDLGTGSGAIALAIARERPDAAVTAVDRSAGALAVATGNAARLGIANVRFRRGSWFDPVAGERFDLVAANPPYLAEHDPALGALAREPRAALVAGPSGLEALARLCAGAPGALRPGGSLVVEHGATQDAAVREMMSAAGFVNIATHRDLAGLPRATRGRTAPDTLESASGRQE
ncbi:MAG TPA: peptide chain release factor N(5)-glutamine methyltransferase [Steroidobacteraceae bacterium]|nr:peptide chain release factor N(5)-glutamine methyltransferase [Steroidobacteraceae bacterium]